MSLQEAGVISGSENMSTLPKRLALDYDGHNMVFLVGCPRSGTTWLQRLLASHPKIRTAQESFIFAVNIGPQLRSWKDETNPGSQRPGGLACYFTQEEFHRILKTYLLTLIEPMVGPLRPGEFFLEKTPSTQYLLEIFELLPRARVIHVLRDARDVVTSLISNDEWIAWWAPRQARDAASMWAGSIKAVRDALPKLPPERFHEVRYESLSRSPVEVLRGCADFLGLEWGPIEIAKAVEANEASKARTNSGGTPIPQYGEVAKRFGPKVVDPKGFIRKATPGSWKEDLSLYQQLRVWRIAHRLMEEVGYHWPMARETAFSCVSASVDLAKMLFSPKRKRNRAK